MFKSKLFAMAPLMLLVGHAVAGELIQNGQFMDPAFDASYWNTFNPDGAYIYGSAFPIPHWAASGGSGVWLPSATMFNSMPGGTQAGWTSDGGTAGSLTQDTGYVLQANTSLTFSFDVGDRSDLLSKYTLVSSGTAVLEGGSSPIAAVSYSAPGTTGDWTHVSVFLAASGLTSYVGQDLSVVLSSPVGAQASWTNMSLQTQAVPEPAPFAACGLGVGLLALRRRRKA